jgi:hypothetical protein
MIRTVWIEMTQVKFVGAGQRAVKRERIGQRRHRFLQQAGDDGEHCRT